jgi:hypothetical protein
MSSQPQEAVAMDVDMAPAASVPVAVQHHLSTEYLAMFCTPREGDSKADQWKQPMNIFGISSSPHSLADADSRATSDDKQNDMPFAYALARAKKWTQRSKKKLSTDQQAMFTASHIPLDGSRYTKNDGMSTLSVPASDLKRFYESLAVDFVDGRRPCLSESVYRTKPDEKQREEVNVYFDLDFKFRQAGSGEPASIITAAHVVPIARVCQAVMAKAFQIEDDDMHVMLRCVVTCNEMVSTRGTATKFGAHVHFPRLRVNLATLSMLLRLVTWALMRLFPWSAKHCGILLRAVTPACDDDDHATLPLVLVSPWTDVVDPKVVSGKRATLRLPLNHKLATCDCDGTACPLAALWPDSKNNRSHGRYRHPGVHNVYAVLNGDGSCHHSLQQQLHQPAELAARNKDNCFLMLKYCSIMYEWDDSVGKHMQPWARDNALLDDWYRSVVPVPAYSGSDDDEKGRETLPMPCRYETYGTGTKPLTKEQKAQLAMDTARHVCFPATDNAHVPFISVQCLHSGSKGRKKPVEYRVLVDIKCPFRFRRHKSSKVYVSITPSWISIRCECTKTNGGDGMFADCKYLQTGRQRPPPRMIPLLFPHVKRSLCRHVTPVKMWIDTSEFFFGLEENPKTIAAANKKLQQSYNRNVQYLRPPYASPREFVRLYARLYRKMGLRGVRYPHGNSNCSFA